MDQRTPLDEAIFRAGNQAALASALGVTQQAISYWRTKGKVPAEYVLKVETATRVSRHALRPDIFGAAPTTGEAA
jgi:DNA-binding transcriptional regulator YdaS (Cro superfamily)